VRVPVKNTFQDFYDVNPHPSTKGSGK